MHITVRRTEPDAAVAASVLADLPEGYVLPHAVADYQAAATHMVTYHAVAEDAEVVGVLLLEPHFRESVEVYLMAVRSAYLRQGIGRRLLAAVEGDARAFGTRLIQAKTLGPSHPDPRYAATRAFYDEMGFLPVEEIHGLWPDKPALLMVRVL
ncbi:MAG: GNAT family N-acetyltransferase [Propionicimonas sp.]|nr:GNAT family N-acetyltransferase [Propionicimonas sp.]